VCVCVCVCVCVFSSLIAELALTPTGESGNSHDAAELPVNHLLIRRSGVHAVF